MRTEEDIIISLCKTFIVCLGVILTVVFGTLIFWYYG